jgi:hypothetical protein
MDSQSLLKEINNQCAVVLTVIAVCFETPDKKELAVELKRLKKILDEYFQYFIEI